MSRSIITEPNALNVVDRCFGVKNFFPTGYPSFGVMIRNPKKDDPIPPEDDITIADPNLKSVNITRFPFNNNITPISAITSEDSPVSIFDPTNLRPLKSFSLLSNLRPSIRTLVGDDDDDGWLDDLDSHGYPPNDTSITYAFGTGLTVNSEDPKSVTNITISRYDINGADIINIVRYWLFYANIEVTFYLDSATGSAAYNAPSEINCGNLVAQVKGFSESAQSFSFAVGYLGHEGEVFNSPITITYHFRVLWCNGGEIPKKKKPEPPKPPPPPDDDPKNIHGDVDLIDLIAFLLTAIKNLKCRIECLEKCSECACPDPEQCSIVSKGEIPGPIVPTPYHEDDHDKSDDPEHYD